MANPILMLNDFCFLEIFKHLTLHDLANFKEAFKCLDAVTDMAFERMTSGKLLFQGIYDSNEKYDPERSKQILKEFGSSVHTLKIWYLSVQETKWSEIFSSINEHCKEKLSNLSLVGENVALITKADVFFIIDILKNLETIELDACANKRPHFSEFLEILCHCEKVKSIMLNDRIDIDLHKTIFRKNKNLLKLTWSGILKDSKTIVDNLTNTQLEEMIINLAYDSCNESFAELKRLDYLKHLEIVGSVNDINPFLQSVDNFYSLKILTLTTRLNDQAIATLGRMTRLKFLKLRVCYLLEPAQSKFILVLCGNKSLEHLQFYYCHNFERIDTAIFLQIIEKRKESTSEKCFHLILDNCHYTKVLKAIPFELLEANKATIKVIKDD